MHTMSWQPAQPMPKYMIVNSRGAVLQRHLSLTDARRKCMKLVHYGRSKWYEIVQE